MLHAGLDLSRRKLDVHVLDEQGETVTVLAVSPDADALRGLAAEIARYGQPVAAVIESMNGARFVHDRLELLIRRGQRYAGFEAGNNAEVVAAPRNARHRIDCHHGPRVGVARPKPAALADDTDDRIRDVVEIDRSTDDGRIAGEAAE